MNTSNQTYGNLQAEGVRRGGAFDATEKSKEASLLTSRRCSTVVDPFEEIMDGVGTHGRYQFFYNLIFITAMAMAGAMLYMNIILALNVPDHWCTVPGREHTNLTLDEWRSITLPM